MLIKFIPAINLYSYYDTWMYINKLHVNAAQWNIGFSK